MPRQFNLYRDSINGLYAAGTSTTMAWALIRNECHVKNLTVPTMDKIKLVRKLNEKETDQLFNKS